MPDDGKKPIKAELKIDPRTEMDGRAIKWLDSVDELKKKYRPFTYSDELELDPRKWDKTKLSKALEALVRYELKRLAVQVANAWKAVGTKASPKEFNAAVKGLLKEYDDIAREIDDKCSLALEELASDKGDNKKGLRDGKAAFAKMKNADLAKAFSGPRNTVVKAFEALAKALKAASGNEKGASAAFAAAASAMDAARKDFDGNAKDAEAAVDFLLKTAEAMQKNSAAAPELQAFGAKIKKEERELNAFLAHLRDFDVDINDAVKDVKQKTMEADRAAERAKGFEKHAGLDKEGADIQKVVAELAKDFAQVEKLLK